MKKLEERQKEWDDTHTGINAERNMELYKYGRPERPSKELDDLCDQMKRPVGNYAEKLQKIAFVKKESLSDLDIPKIHEQINLEHGKKYNEILTQAIENYLGRPVDLINDAPLITLIEKPNGDRGLFYEDDLIGTIKHEIAYDCDDFLNNKITCSISFTPNMKP